ncbi:MAG: 1-(5-phosphoribosyl)-5-[(5-phosphoribosylamino)methylideneamino]imidazole-4-carboxamide isomerase [Arenimonas sp.]|jgi:phosphoribosylformimino-5-aminoimidazole carboxamide ribotide isomerase
MAFTVIPAIDVRNACVVRLSQGDYGRETVYDATPLQTAQRYAAAGAQWLHLVDLDAARLGAYSLQPLVAELRRSTELKIQTGGGIRSEANVEALLKLGVARVVVGTLAVREPARVAGWLRDYGSQRVVLALDARVDANGAWRLPVAGWTENTGGSLEQLLDRYADAGLRHVLCTDIARDGMLGGFNLELYGMLARRWPHLHIQASGGVRSVDDIVAARAAGASAAILGRALLEDRLQLAGALSC